MTKDLHNCAALVERADPDRFRAAMAAPVAARAVLFPLYAFNVEVSRAPWVTAEAMIAEMRLQWWREALGEIASGGPVRRHEVVTPLSAILPAASAQLLDEYVAARSWDIYNDPFVDAEALGRYLDQTSGHLMVAAAKALGAEDVGAVRDYAWATGLANWLVSVPDWRARGRRPLPEAPGVVNGLVEQGLDRLTRARAAGVPKAARAALLPGWRSGAILRRAAAEPERIETGGLLPSPARAQLGLMWQAATGRV